MSKSKSNAPFAKVSLALAGMFVVAVIISFCVRHERKARLSTTPTPRDSDVRTPSDRALPVNVAHVEGTEPKYLAPPAAANTGSGTPAAKDSSDRIELFLRERNNIEFSQAYVRSRLNEEDLAALYRMLDDESRAIDWRNVLFSICVLEDDEKAIKVAEELITRYWDWQGSQSSLAESQLIIRSIILSITVVGLLDESVSAPFLKAAFTEEGARSLLSNWLGNPLPDHEEFQETILSDAIFAAGGGLLHTRSPELFSIVEERYKQLCNRPSEDLNEFERAVLGACISLMAERDVYLEMGWDEGVRYVFDLEPESRIQLIMGRSLTYYKEIREEKAEKTKREYSG